MRTWTGHKLLATNQAQGWTMHRDRPAAGPSHRPEMLIEETYRSKVRRGSPLRTTRPRRDPAASHAPP